MAMPIPAIELPPSAAARRDELFEINRQDLQRRTDRLFGLVMLLQYVGGVIAAAILSPRTWDGVGTVHPHLTMALVLGLLIAAPVWFLAAFFPGCDPNRFIIAIAQMLMSCLLIHISGGRMETHFHVFGSLAFLGFYRDWRVLVPAVLVVLADHALRGYFIPMSVYGIPTGAEWRFLEHAGWILFCAVFIGAACVQSRKEMYAVAERQALVEETKSRIEHVVIDRTHDLRESEARKTAIVASALDGIFALDGSGRITEMNPSAIAIFGFEDSQTRHPHIDKLISLEAGRGSIFDVMAAIKDRADGEGVRMEGTGFRPDGDFPMEISISPVHVYGEVTFTVLVRDVSERKRLEAKVSHGEKMETLGRLATGIAHEINTPNQFIADNVRFLQDSFSELQSLVESYRKMAAEARAGSVSEETLRDVSAAEALHDFEFLSHEIPNASREALEGVERVGGIVKAMRQFSHPGTMRKEPINVNAVVSGALAVSRNEWKNTAKLEVCLEEEIPDVLGHAGDLGQAVLNLVVNACHAVRERHQDARMGVLKISTMAAGDTVMIEIEDDGCGIPAKNLKKVFEPFFTTKGVGIGTGQGLALVHRAVVELMGGDVEVHSEPGQGTRFTLRFPVPVREAVH
ncbi:two-component system sensor histidine kinase NtrB [Fimbriimonas ginsengisoli]|uniref:histidine kinase n=1 Tax=Fimbriimonas ginsengisoli Gsoil 348 TaxID=661478 RepID=A0A068NIV8_FIMGI|nr:ATP-binding protein [Fimbriimonas ginsengisoli]AIE83456.1 RedC [Fimbriimonas ginsengisoli Gsoil 348]